MCDNINVTEIRKKAQKMGLTLRGIHKTNLIHAIQKNEGNAECFNSNNSKCEEMECCWRNNCMAESKEPR